MNIYDDNSKVYWGSSFSIYDAMARQRRSVLLGSSLFAFIGIIVIVVVALLPSVRGILEAREQILMAELQGMQRIPDLEARITELEKRIGILTTDAINSRVGRIEQAFELGQLDEADIADISRLASDMKELKSYLFSDAKEMAEFRELQKNYQSMSAAQSGFATKEALKSEIDSLKFIVNLVLGFGAMLMTVVFGSWWFLGRRGRQEPESTRPIQRRDGTPHFQGSPDETGGRSE